MVNAGWNFPPGFYNFGNKVATNTAVDRVKQSLHIIFSTHLGERLKYPEFGCNLSQFNFEPITNQFVTSLEDEISNAIEKHEPSINQFNIELGNSVNAPETINISVKYWLDGVDEEQVLIYPLVFDNI